MADHPGPLYTYQPLQGPRHIRLINLTALKIITPGVWYISLDSEIYHADLSSPPKYIALSYTWGEPKFDWILPVGKQHLRITQNLYDALVAIGPTIERKGLSIWIDAVCINQADLAERGAQVELMRDIYQGAEDVYAYLGAPSLESGFALQTMNTWIMAMQRLVQELGAGVGTLEAVTVERIVFGEGVGGDSADERMEYVEGACRELFKFSTRGYFSRAWILQEVSLRSSVWMWCGDDYFHIENLKFYNLILERLKFDPLYGHLFLRILQSPHTAILNLRRILINQHQQIPFLEGLELLRSRECTDPRDRVYAALGVISGGAGSIKPDYTKSVVEVYMDVVRYCLDHLPAANRLSFLGLVIGRPADLNNVLSPLMPPADESLPTWVPDWRSRFEMPPFVHHTLKLYNAGGGGAMKAHIDGNRFLIDGAQVDIVESVFAVSMDLTSIAPELSWVPPNMESQYVTGCTVAQAFVATLTADARKKTTGSEGWVRGFTVDWMLQCEDDASVSPADIDERMSQRVCIKRTTMFRRFFRTRMGYMGIGPGAMEVGDQVCVLFGGQLLHILRAHDDTTHAFVGECYVHGLVDGEALDGSNGTRLESKTFTLF